MNASRAELANRSSPDASVAPRRIVHPGRGRQHGAKRRAGTLKNRPATNHKCLISSHFSSLTRATRSASEVELGLLSEDARVASHAAFRVATSARADSSARARCSAPRLTPSARTKAMSLTPRKPKNPVR
jgi:hypothetical protein